MATISLTAAPCHALSVPGEFLSKNITNLISQPINRLIGLSTSITTAAVERSRTVFLVLEFDEQEILPVILRRKMDANRIGDVAYLVITAGVTTRVTIRHGFEGIRDSTDKQTANLVIIPLAVELCNACLAFSM